MTTANLRPRLTPTEHATLAWYAGRQARVPGGRVVKTLGVRDALFGYDLLEWTAPSTLGTSEDSDAPRPLRVTEAGLAWLDAAGTVTPNAG